MPTFLAAQMSSRSLVVGRSVGWSVGLSEGFVKQWLIEYQMVTKAYLPTYLWDSSDSSDSSDSRDSSDSSDSSDSNDSSDSSDRSDQKNFFSQFFFSPIIFTQKYHQKIQQLKLWWNSKSQSVMKLINSNCDETLKLQLWWNSKTQFVI